MMNADLLKIALSDAQAQLGQIITPELRAQMTPEQLELIETAMNADKIIGSGDLSGKLEELQSILRKNGC